MEEGWHYWVQDSVERTGEPPEGAAVFTSLEEARAAAKPGQEIWRTPQTGGVGEFVEKVEEGD